MQPALGTGRALSALALALFAAGCANGVLDRRSDLELTWDKAVIALPAEGPAPVRVGTIEDIDLARYLNAQPEGSSLAVVLYLHGCTGIGNFAFFETLAGAGYLVIAPDSMARRFRPLQEEDGRGRGKRSFQN